MPSVPRVLVLEDEPLIAMMLRTWLTELGCETVGPAHTVPSALVLIEQGPLHGAILDVSIGDQDCSSVAEALRQKSIPFALATGHVHAGLPGAFAEAPALPKPYDFAAVRAVVAKLIDLPVRP
jgi:CheY-like chemotaxis protein